MVITLANSISPLVSVIIPTKDRFDKLQRLVNQLKSDNYENKEIIIVDDSSKDSHLYQEAAFSGLLIIRNDLTPSLARCRNLGIKASNGKYLFFIDDDNTISNNTISELVSLLESDNSIGVAGPMMYNFDKPDIIWCAGIKRSFYTSKTTYVGSGAKDEGQFHMAESDEFPNAFMIRRQAIDAAGTFNEELFPFHYGEADLCMKIARQGYKIMMQPSSKIWHDYRDANMTNNTRVSVTRAYYYGRNRLLFHRMYSKGVAKFSFFLFAFIMVIPAYLLIMIKAGRTGQEKKNLMSAYLKGVSDGVGYNGRSLKTTK